MNNCSSGENKQVIAQLATTLIVRLEKMRHTQPSSCPITLTQLWETLDDAASKSQVLQATRLRYFNQNAVLVRSNDLRSPIALLDDLAFLAESDETLQFALSHCSRNKTKAHTVAEMTSVLTNRAGGAIKKQFRHSLQRRIEEQRLPRDVGCIAASGGRQRLFRLDDLQPHAWRDAILASLRGSSQESDSTAPEVPINTAQQVDFHTLFETTFTQLDQVQGGYNFVSLDSLRTALPTFSREEFDAELRKLRISRRYRLSGAENRNDVSEQQREAGINEAGSLLLYAQRIGS